MLVPGDILSEREQMLLAVSAAFVSWLNSKEYVRNIRIFPLDTPFSLANIYN